MLEVNVLLQLWTQATFENLAVGIALSVGCPEFDTLIFGELKDVFALVATATVVFLATPGTLNK